MTHRSALLPTLGVGIVLVAWGAVVAQTDDSSTEAQPTEPSWSITSSEPLLRGVPVEVDLTVQALNAEGRPLEDLDTELRLEGVEKEEAPWVDAVPVRGGVARLEGVQIPSGQVLVEHLGEGTAAAQSVTLRQIPGWQTLGPPILAIVLALVTRQVLISLFCGVWLGAALVHGVGPIDAFLRSADTYIVRAVADEGHASIMIFSLSLAGMVGVMTRIGGVRGIVAIVAKLAKSPRSGQLATWFLGCVIFFDDYANSLIVGNTMRPFTDRVRISREKLAFLVDSTAAPVATIGVISTWTAYQIGLLGDLEGPTGEAIGQPYWFFLQSIPYSFYSFLTLLTVFLSGLTLRDIGPMRRAEERCRSTGAVLRDGAQPLIDPHLDQLGDSDEVRPRWINAALPIAAVVGLTLAGLWMTGSDAARAAGIAAPTASDVIGNADSYRALLWASLGASFVAILLGIVQRYSLTDLLASWVQGAKSLLLAVLILVLAWSIAAVCRDVHTGDYVASLSAGSIRPSLLPLIAFLSAGLMAFATGTSYGTMGILIPILVPLAFSLASGDASLESADATAGARHIALAVLAAILGGAVFGDHCSPISDTTVLSSMASGADHIDHVRTQLPYAMLSAGVASIAYLAVGCGLHALVALPLVLALTVVLWLFVARPARPRAD